MFDFDNLAGMVNFFRVSSVCMPVAFRSDRMTFLYFHVRFSIFRRVDEALLVYFYITNHSSLLYLCTRGNTYFSTQRSNGQRSRVALRPEVGMHARSLFSRTAFTCTDTS